jgi:hypothetical protein
MSSSIMPMWLKWNRHDIFVGGSIIIVSALVGAFAGRLYDSIKDLKKENKQLKNKSANIPQENEIKETLDGLDVILKDVEENSLAQRYINKYKNQTPGMSPSGLEIAKMLLKDAVYNSSIRTMPYKKLADTQRLYIGLAYTKAKNGQELITEE